MLQGDAQMHTSTIGVGHERLLAVSLGVWRLVDPKIAIASVVPFIVGAAIAYDQGRAISAGIALAAYAAVFLVEVGKNAVNDLADYRSGADLAVREDERSPFSGGKRVLVDGLLTERDLVVIGWSAMIAAGAVGVAVALHTRPALLLLGFVASLVGAAYSLPPVKLSYRGWGEAAVFLTYGPGVVLGSLLLFGGDVNAAAVAIAVCFGALIANILLVNEMPDERADRSVGKRTLVVRLGRDRATSLFALLFAATFSFAILGFVFSGSVILLGLVAGAIPADYAIWSLRRERIAPPAAAQTAALITYVAAGAGVVLLALARV